MKEEYEDGFLEIDLDSIDDYMSLISGNKNFEGWLFRGQGDSNWGLNSSYNRECINAREANIYYERKEHLERFRKSIRGRLPISNTDAISDIELWAIGQHYGLKTPLLDWTASPYVALFLHFIMPTALVKMFQFGY
ncbi:TPA: FRG domain-containing protein [Vibrio parahaemolyticus]